MSRVEDRTPTVSMGLEEEDSQESGELPCGGRGELRGVPVELFVWRFVCGDKRNPRMTGRKK